MANLSRRSKGDLFSILPAGIVLPFAGATAPDGWAVCDGSIISRSDYSELYLAVGDAHGNGDGSTTFHLPDMRGRFMRGADSAAGRDPDAATRTASNTGGNTGDNVGSVQGESTNANGITATTSTSTTGGTATSAGSHTHSNIIEVTSGSGIESLILSSYRTDAAITINSNSITTDGAHTHPITGISSSSSTTISGGGSETRSLNANMNYIIKL